MGAVIGNKGNAVSTQPDLHQVGMVTYGSSSPQVLVEKI